MAINEIINIVCDGSFYVSSWMELSQDSDIWSNISLDVAMKVFFFFLHEINTEISRLCVKQITLYDIGGPRPIS